MEARPRARLDFVHFLKILGGRSVLLINFSYLNIVSRRFIVSSMAVSTD